MSEFVCHKCGRSFDEMHKWCMDCLFLCRDCYDFLLDGRLVIAGIIQSRQHVVPLRDWFAGIALILLKSLWMDHVAPTDAVKVAEEAWRIADAMLAERERPRNGAVE